MKSRLRHALVFGLLVSLGSPYAEAVDTKETGKWVKGTFAQVNVFCIQAYQCIPGVNVLHSSDTVVRTTPNEGVKGVCNAGGGAAGSCNICASNPPTTACEYWLEKKR